MSENKNVPSSLHYPKARVILGFLLMGGGLGGWLFWAALKVHDAGVWFADFKRGIHLAAAFGAAHRTLRCVERGDIGSNFVSERFE